VLLLVRRKPGSTVSQLAQELGVSGVAVRRQLAALAADGLVESITPVEVGDEPARGPGRPPGGWRVTAAALAEGPANYDGFALDLLGALADRDGVGAVDDMLTRQSDRLGEHYRCCLAELDALGDRVTRLAELRDDAGYAASATVDANGDHVLTECNCAVYRVAERYPMMCDLELEVMREVLGPSVDVQRVSHTMQIGRAHV